MLFTKINMTSYLTVYARHPHLVLVPIRFSSRIHTSLSLLGLTLTFDPERSSGVNFMCHIPFRKSIDRLAIPDSPVDKGACLLSPYTSTRRRYFDPIQIFQAKLCHLDLCTPRGHLGSKNALIPFESPYPDLLFALWN